MDPAIAPLVESIDEVLAATPRKGKIDGASLAALRGVVMLLTDPTRMREHGNLVLRGECPGLLGARDVAESGAGDDASTLNPETQEVAGPNPATKRVPAQRPSAFW